MIFKLNSKIKALFFLLFLLIILQNYDCYAQSISSNELINNAKNYDGQTVVYRGEVIGDIMLRREYAWINLNDGKNAIGIWIKKELINDILYTGSYKSRGDIVEIIGRFHRACREHGGDLDIHAQSINKISSGIKIFHTVNKKEVSLILALASIITVVFLLRLIQRNLKRNVHLF